MLSESFQESLKYQSNQTDQSSSEATIISSNLTYRVTNQHYFGNILTTQHDTTRRGAAQPNTAQQVYS